MSKLALLGFSLFCCILGLSSTQDFPIRIEVIDYRPAESVLTLEFKNESSGDYLIPSVDGQPQLYYEYWNVKELGLVLVDKAFYRMMLVGAVFIDDGIKVPAKQSIRMNIYLDRLVPYGNEEIATSAWRKGHTSSEAFRIRAILRPLNAPAIESASYRWPLSQTKNESHEPAKAR